MGTSNSGRVTNILGTGRCPVVRAVEVLHVLGGQLHECGLALRRKGQDVKRAVGDRRIHCRHAVLFQHSMRVTASETEGADAGNQPLVVLERRVLGRVHRDGLAERDHHRRFDRNHWIELLEVDLWRHHFVLEALQDLDQS